jgi:hypothetical protein
MLSTVKFNFYQMLSCDLMHEVELGVWKALFCHIIRMLHTQGVVHVQELNGRQVWSTFASDVYMLMTIHSGSE